MNRLTTVISNYVHLVAAAESAAPGSYAREAALMQSRFALEKMDDELERLLVNLTHGA